MVSSEAKLRPSRSLSAGTRPKTKSKTTSSAATSGAVKIDHFPQVQGQKLRAKPPQVQLLLGL